MKSTYDLLSVEYSGDPHPAICVRVNILKGGTKEMWALTGNHVTVTVDGKRVPTKLYHMHSSRRINAPDMFIGKALFEKKEYPFIERINTL